MSYYNQQRSGGRSGQSRPYRSNSGGGGHSRGPKKAYIHPSKFVKSAKPLSEEVYTPLHQFADFNVHQLIKNNLEYMGFKSPSPIQDQTISVALEGRDVVGIANTGTGKTAAFAIPMLNRLLEDRNAQALIMAPTRELAQQIEEQCRQISRGGNISDVLLIGGVNIGAQLRSLRQNPRLIIGTPGRIKDHLERRTLNLSHCSVLVLDEVDRMLDMGFVNDIRHILNLTGDNKQSFYFSATLDNKVNAIISEFSRDPVQISVKSGDTSDNVEQNIIPYGSTGEKMEKLHDLLIQEATVKTLIFDDTHRSVEKLSMELALRGFSADSIHGGKSQSQRQRVLKKFRDNQIKVLVATDVAARGLDVSDITHVVNFSSPHSYDDYIHRIGRTGRAGKTGFALTFVDK